MRLLQDKEKISNYTIERMLSHDEGDYRQVYLARDRRGRRYALTAYDMEATPEYLIDAETSRPREITLATRLSDELLCPAQDTVQRRNGHPLCAMLQEWLEDTETLTDHICSHGPFAVKVAIDAVAALATALSELKDLTAGGGHYDICPDNIRVGMNDHNEPVFYLLNLRHASRPAKGRPDIDRSRLHDQYRAPETLLGIYSCQSDVYSFARTLCYMEQGKLEGERPDKPLAESLKSMADAQTQRSLKGLYPNLLAEAFDPSPRHRYGSVADFARALSARLGKKAADSGDDDYDDDYDGEPEDDDEDFYNLPVDMAPSTLGDRFDGQSAKTSGSIQFVKAEKKGGFDDVAGLKALKKELLRDYVSILKHRELAARYRINCPNGLLLYGPGGCGKTLLASKIAEESGLNFCIVSPADIGSIYIHGSQKIISDIFKKAEKSKPALLILDEFDAMVPRRDDQRNQQQNEVNEFLTQLNNCAERGVYVIACTNHPDALDTAVMRKGRIDTAIFVGLPDEDARRELFAIELKDRPAAESLDTERLVSLTDQFTGSDISYIVNEAARQQFEKTLDSGGASPEEITQSVLEEIISSTRPSVSEEDKTRFEKLRKKFADRGVNRDHRPHKLGFTTGS